MRRNLLFKNLGVAVAVAAFAFVACDDSSSAPETSGLDYSSDSAALSSSDEQGFSSSGDDALSSSGTDNPISSSLIAESSSSFLPKSSATCLSMDTSCGWTAEQLCNMGQARYCISSSSLAVSSSSIAESSSAGFLEECINFARMCRNCDGPDCPIPYRPCSECYDEGMMAEDCVTGGVYQCKNGLWNLADRSQCLNVVLIPCTGDSAKCGRVPCNSNAPKTVIDCGSGEEYVCADAYWTPMKETESCSRIIGAKNGSDGRKCSNKGARTVDCARNVEYECLSAGFWEQINPTIGDTCLVDGGILEGYIETSAGAREHTIFMCFEGKWEKYRGTYESLRCVDAAVVRTPCDVNDAEKEWIHQGDCDYQCRNGEYVFVPKLANE
ncbi:hypothetical protein SAMN05720781_2880 [Fibrobacter sp. UWT3]|uniref:hypothetical protein n=1 Tax=Fibrobacter sp. UWT3 TaxID=1896225 RepID=UPI000BC920F7|nr:hypothetical protein [Fibrobacter sp. UWT3]SOE79113.1 hypothetical protein SAMN05720781_2880 [Fibrobacter sp. UWT3]